MITFLLICLCLPLLLSLCNFLHRVWWNPIYVQYAMRSQGIKGPSYRFLDGTTQEAINMKMESASVPMDLSSHDMFRRINPDIYSWMKIYGKNFLIWHGHQAHLVVTEPELIEEILINKDGAFPKIKLEGYAKKLFGDALPVADGEKWSKLRKLAHHAFYADGLRDMFPAMVASVEAMLERWKHHEGKEIEVYEEFTVLTSEIIARTAFGSSYMEGKNIFEMVMKLGAFLSRKECKIRIPGTGKLFRSHDDIESDIIQLSLRDSIIAVITEREKKLMTGEAASFGNDFLGLLIKANHEADDKYRISIDSVIDECKTFYIAGRESTSSSLTWIILLLAIHTDWQEKARKEVLERFGQQNPTLEGITRLKTLSMIIDETLRLYSPDVEIPRKVRSKVRLGKFILPANIHLHIPTLAPHYNPELWGQDVHHFKPERFSEGVAKATKNKPAAFIPFGIGPRACVGSNFVIIELKITLSIILQRYKFTLSPNYVHSPFQFLAIRPQHGVQVVLHLL